MTCVLVLDALIGEQGLAETVRARRQHRLALASLTQLRAENARLRDEVRRLTQDPRTIEHIARGELGLISPGEILIVVKDRSSR